MTAEAPGKATTPLVEKLPEALSPQDAFERLAGLPYILFLDSAAENDTQVLYSYITARPFEVLKTTGDSTELLAAEGELDSPSYKITGVEETDPFEVLRRRLKGWATPSLPNLPPFQGGAAGLLGYGLAHSIEKISRPRHDEFAMPDLVIGLYDWVIAWDHLEKCCHIISHGFPETGPDRRERAARQIETLKKLLGGNERIPKRPGVKTPPPLTREELA